MSELCTYTFKQLPAGTIEGGTKMELVKNSRGEDQAAAVMSIVGDANAIHELTHAYMGTMTSSNVVINSGGAAFLGGTVIDQQIANTNFEIAGYKAQYSFDPGSMPSSTMGGTPQNINAINAPYVGGINDSSNKPVYPHVLNLVNTLKQLLGLF